MKHGSPNNRWRLKSSDQHPTFAFAVSSVLKCTCLWHRDENKDDSPGGELRGAGVRPIQCFYHYHFPVRPLWAATWPAQAVRVRCLHWRQSRNDRVCPVSGRQLIALLTARFTGPHSAFRSYAISVGFAPFHTNRSNAHLQLSFVCYQGSVVIQSIHLMQSVACLLQIRHNAKYCPPKHKTALTCHLVKPEQKHLNFQLLGADNPKLVPFVPWPKGWLLLPEVIADLFLLFLTSNTCFPDSLW